MMIPVVSNRTRFFIVFLSLLSLRTIEPRNSWAREIFLGHLDGTIVASVSTFGFCHPNTPGPDGYGTTCQSNDLSCSCFVFDGTVNGSVGHGSATVIMSVNGDSTSGGAPAEGVPSCSPMFASLLLTTQRQPGLILNVNGSVCYGPNQNADIPERILGGFSTGELNALTAGETYWGMVSGDVKYKDAGPIRLGYMTLKFTGNISAP
jgi:hypothetical protein